MGLFDDDDLESRAADLHFGRGWSWSSALEVAGGLLRSRGCLAGLLSLVIVGVVVGTFLAGAWDKVTEIWDKWRHDCIANFGSVDIDKENFEIHGFCNVCDKPLVVKPDREPVTGEIELHPDGWYFVQEIWSFQKSEKYRFEQLVYVPSPPPPHVHTEVVTKEGYPATCTDCGLSDEIYCSDPECGKLLQEQKPTEPLGHSIYTVGATAATCSDRGFTGDERCRECDYSAPGHYTEPTGEHGWEYSQDYYDHALGRYYYFQKCTWCERERKIYKD